MSSSPSTPAPVTAPTPASSFSMASNMASQTPARRSRLPHTNAGTGSTPSTSNATGVQSSAPRGSVMPRQPLSRNGTLSNLSPGSSTSSSGTPAMSSNRRLASALSTSAVPVERQNSTRDRSQLNADFSASISSASVTSGSQSSSERPNASERSTGRESLLSTLPALSPISAELSLPVAEIEPIPEVKSDNQAYVSPTSATQPNLPLSPIQLKVPIEDSLEQSTDSLTKIHMHHKCAQCGHQERIAIPTTSTPHPTESQSRDLLAKKALANFRDTLQQEKWLRKKDTSLEAFALASQAKIFELEAECDRLRSALTEQISTNRSLYHNFLEALDECQKRVQEADSRVAESRKELRNEEAKVIFATNLCNSTREDLEHTRKCFLLVTQRLCVQQMVKNYRLYHRILRVLELVANLREVVFGPGGLGPESLPTAELLEVYENNTQFRKRYSAFKNFQPGGNVRRPKATQLLNLLQDSLEEFIVPLRRLTARVNNLVSVNDAFFKRNIVLSATTQQAKSRAAALRDEVDELKLKLGQTEQQILKLQHSQQPDNSSGMAFSITPRTSILSTSMGLGSGLSKSQNTSTFADPEPDLRQSPDSNGTLANRQNVVLGPTTPSVNVPGLFYRTPFVPVRVRGSASLNWQTQQNPKK